MDPSLRTAAVTSLRAAARVLAGSMWLETAWDTMAAPLRMWVHYGNWSDKKELFQAYEELEPKARQAWDDDVAAAMRRAGGGTEQVMYRRMKGGEAGIGGASVTTEPPTHGSDVQAFKVSADDVLAHYAQADSPLASRAFGHEREVILKLTAKPRPVDG